MRWLWGGQTAPSIYFGYTNGPNRADHRGLMPSRRKSAAVLLFPHRSAKGVFNLECAANSAK